MRIVLLTAVLAHAGPTTHSVVGTLQLTELPTKIFDQPRTIRIWLPPQYDTDLLGTFDVLYMHDAQNCFDLATSSYGKEWQIDETLTRLIAEGAVPPMIVVAIDNGGKDRTRELTFDADPRHGGGEANAYTRFLLGDVLPWMKLHYRIKTGPAHTLLGGSSLGGLVTLEIVRRHPGVFGGAIAMSPSVWWNGESILKRIESDPGGLTQTRLWLDIGTRENFKSADDPENQKTVEQIQHLDAILTQAQVAHQTRVIPDAVHDETAWAKRFADAIQYLTRSGAPATQP